MKTRSTIYIGREHLPESRIYGSPCINEFILVLGFPFTSFLLQLADVGTIESTADRLQVLLSIFWLQSSSTQTFTTIFSIDFLLV